MPLPPDVEARVKTWLEPFTGFRYRFVMGDMTIDFFIYEGGIGKVVRGLRDDRGDEWSVDTIHLSPVKTQHLILSVISIGTSLSNIYNGKVKP